MGDPVKRWNWGNWATIQPSPNKKRITCFWCAFYQEDNSCEKQPIVISEIKPDYWKICDYFRLDSAYDTPENRKHVLTIRPDYIFADNNSVAPTNSGKHEGQVLAPRRLLQGKKVTHRTFGVGTIVLVDGSSLTISFPCGQKKFKFPDAFREYLSFVDNDVRLAVETYIT